MAQIPLAHSLDTNRTKDVILDENVTFESLLLNENVLKGLTKNGFKKPSPIQIKAIPIGRCGFDLIVRAKSGTGKTLVYSIVALETIEIHKNQTEVLILAPTREIAVQIQEVLLCIGSNIEGLKIESFIGGLSVEGDKDKCKICHIAVGAPGRVKHLIREGILKTNSIRLMVLDEVDKLMDSSFLSDVNEIYNSLPDRKQIITTSATYSSELKNILCKYMLSPIYIAVENSTPLLLGLKQFVKIIKPHANVVQQMKIKSEELFKIFSNISFTQCLIFTNYQTRAQSISNVLNQKGWHSTYISAAQSQTERLATVNNFKNFKCRIMLSTDLTARGIDAANVDLVINYDIPIDTMTYLHRMGRAGRYGSSGICINLAFAGNELQQLQNILGTIGGQSLSIPKLPKFEGALLDLLNIHIPTENHIYGTISNNTNIMSTNTKINIKKNILKLKVSKMHKEENKLEERQEYQSNFHETYSDLKCKNSEEQITDILNVTKKEVEAVSKNFSDVDANIILKSLASGDSKVYPNIACGSSYPVLKQLMSPDLEECKKRKRSREDEVLELLDVENDQLREKQKVEDYIFHKNRALISISNILASEKSNNEFGIDSIQEFLDNIKEQDQNEISNVMIKSESQNEMDLLKNIDKFEYLQETCTKEGTNKCINNIESIFKLGYESAIKSNSRHWQSYLPESEIKRFQNLCLKETNYNKSYEIEDEIYDDYDMEDDYNCGKDLTTEFYDNTNNQDYINENFMKWIPVEKTEKNDHIIETQITNWEHLNTNFSHCSEYLWHNGLSFKHLEDFDNWFRYEWQGQVFAIRNYTQQYIYVEEMKKYQETTQELNKNIN